MTDEGFIPYFVLVRFDKDADLRDRLEDSLPLLRSALAECGSVEPVTSSYDGSAVAFLLEARANLQPGQILSQLQSPASRKPSPLKLHDKVLVLAIECGAASKLERATEWLGERGVLV
jgi:hypothetical protein